MAEGQRSKFYFIWLVVAVATFAWFLHDLILYDKANLIPLIVAIGATSRFILRGKEPSIDDSTEDDPK